MKKAKYGKMRQVKAVNGSQMVVKIGVDYYRWVKGKKGDKLEVIVLSRRTFIPLLQAAPESTEQNVVLPRMDRCRLCGLMADTPVRNC